MTEVAEFKACWKLTLLEWKLFQFDFNKKLCDDKITVLWGKNTLSFFLPSSHQPKLVFQSLVLSCPCRSRKIENFRRFIKI